MTLTGFEPTISVDERPQTYAVHRAAIGTGNLYKNDFNNIFSTTPYA